MGRICERKIKTIDYNVINEFAIRHFPSNSVSKKNRQKENSETRKKIHSQIVKKNNVITFYLDPSFLCFSQKRNPWEGLGKDIGQLVLRFYKQYLDESVFIRFSSRICQHVLCMDGTPDCELFAHHLD